MKTCFNEDFRKIHTLYVSPVWAKNRGNNFNASIYAKRLAESGVKWVNIYAKDHHGICYYKSSKGLDYPIDVIGDFIREAHKQDIKVIAYFSVGFDEYAFGKNPQWLYMDKEGNPREYWPFRWGCLNSGYTEYALEQFEELVSQYPADGFWLDIIPLAWGERQELYSVGNQPAPCYCINCRKQFFEIYGTELPLKPTIQEQIKVYQFLINGVRKFLEKAYNLVEKYHPEAIVSYNGAGAPGDPLKNADLISIEGHMPHYSRQSFLSRWARSHTKPFELLTTGAMTLPDGWNGWDQKPPEVLQLEVAIPSSHGGSMTIGQAPHTDGSVNPGEFDAFKQIFGHIQKVEPYLRKVNSTANIALYMSIKPYKAPQHWKEIMAATEAFHESMLDHQLQYDITEDIDRIEDYDIVILANQKTLSNNELDKLREYVNNGGKLVATALTSLYDDEGHQRNNFGLHDVMGVNFLELSNYSFAYLTLEDEQLHSGISAVPLLYRDRVVNIEPKKGSILANSIYPEMEKTKATTVLWGNPAPDWENKTPAVILNEYGKGVCVYAAFDPRCNGAKNLWIKQLTINLIKKVLSEENRILTSNTPAGVELVLNQKEEKHILHIINHHVGVPNMTSIGDNEMILKEISIQLNKRKLSLGNNLLAYTIPDKNQIPIKQGDDWIQLFLPKIDIWTTVIIEEK